MYVFSTYRDRRAQYRIVHVLLAVLRMYYVSISVMHTIQYLHRIAGVYCDTLPCILWCIYYYVSRIHRCSHLSAAEVAQEAQQAGGAGLVTVQEHA